MHLKSFCKEIHKLLYRRTDIRVYNNVTTRTRLRRHVYQVENVVEKNIFSRTLTLSRMDLLGAAHGWGERGQKGPASLKPVTHIL